MPTRNEEWLFEAAVKHYDYLRRRERGEYIGMHEDLMTAQHLDAAIRAIEDDYGMPREAIVLRRQQAQSKAEYDRKMQELHELMDRR